MPEPIQFAIAWAIVIGTLGGVATLLTVVRARVRASAPQPAIDLQELADLRESVQRLNGDLADLHERVDFAERLLAKQRDAEKLKGA